MDEENLIESELYFQKESLGPKKKEEEARELTWRNRLKLVTVEPTMFLYMMAFMLTSVVEQAFFIHKACTVDLGYPEDVCLNLTKHNETNKKVQVVVSTFHQNQDIASHAIPIVLALFVGAWSDRRGRKILLLLGLAGKLWYSVWIVINSLQGSWKLDKVIWTASFPSGFTGADLSIFAAAFAYISDITTPENRTLRITILDLVYLASMPMGVALGKLLFTCFDGSYAKMFTVNASLLLIAFAYSFIRLDWATNRRQRPPIFCCCQASERGEDERQMSYLYTNLKFQWSVNSFSDFRVFQTGIYVLGVLLCIPLMSKFFKLSDTCMLMVGTFCHAAARVVFALAQKPWLFYLGAGIASLGPVAAPVLRSMASKIVPAEERGKVFAILSVADTTVPLFSGVIYSQVYNATIHSYPSAIYWVTVTTQMFVFAVATVIRFTSRNQPLESCAEEI